MKKLHELFLHFWCQVDQQVAAGQDIDLGKGRILNHALLSKDHHIPNALEFHLT